jgi:hypothetical protein
MNFALRDKKFLDPQKISLSSVSHCGPMNRKTSIYPPDLSPQNFFSAYTQKKESLCRNIQSCRKVIPALTHILPTHFSTAIMSTL